MTQLSRNYQPHLILESKIILKLASPVIATQILQMSTVVLDTLMAGRANAVELSGVAVGSSLWVPLFLLLIGTLSALTPTIAQLAGSRRWSHMPFQVHQSLWKLLILLPFAWLTNLGVTPIFEYMKVNENIMPVATGYITAMMWGLPALLAYNMLRYFSDGLGLTKPAMYAALLGLMINAPLNYVLIFGEFGFPQLGGVGCGWASAISFWVMFIFMLAWVLIRVEYKHCRLFQRFYKPSKKHIFSLYKTGFPIGAAFLVESSVFSLIALFISRFDATVVAAHQIALNVASLLFMVPLSIGLTLTIRIGQIIGAKEYQRARYVANLGISMALMYGLITGLLLWAFRLNIPQLYNDQPEVILLCSELLLFAALFQIGDAAQVAIAGSLRGYKDTRVPMYLTIIAFWVIAMPLGYSLGIAGVTGKPLMAHGFWIGLIAGLMSVAGLLYVRLMRVSKKRIKGSSPS